jgi:uncharacterized membrane protein SpoIIM required for sporulation
MNRTRFISTRQKDWYRFRQLLGRAEQIRLTKLGGEEVSEFSRLFRALCYDLAVVRSRDWGVELERRLNDLVVRGHSLYYRTAPGGKGRAVLSFLLSGFPRLLRQNQGYFWVALALFVVPGLIAGVLIAVDPELAERMMSAEMLAKMESMHSTNVRSGGLFTGTEVGATGFYISNNVGIAFRCFALGILFGVGTAVLLVYNSMVLGAVTGYLVAKGHAMPFFSFVISHGAFELTAIVIAGAAGLVLGRAIVHPGQHTRVEALRVRGLVAIKLAAGAGAMLGVAAFVEGFWSPSGVPMVAKFIVGTILWAAVIAYLALAGRREVSTTQEEMP